MEPVFFQQEGTPPTFIEHAELRQTHLLKENEILLGFRNLWEPEDILACDTSTLRQEIVKFPLNLEEKPKNMLITGGNGSGKSYGFGFDVCIDQIIRYMRPYFNLLFIDPSGEYERMNYLKPLSDPAWEVWSAVNRLPKYRASVDMQIPYVCASDDGERDASFKIPLEKIRKNDLLMLLDLTEDKAEDENQIDILNDAITIYYNKLGKARTPNPLCPNMEDLITCIREASTASKVLMRKIKNLKYNGYIGEETEGYCYPNFARNLYADLPLGSVQAVQTTLDINLSWEIAGLINFIIGTIRDEQERRFKINKKEGDTSKKGIVHMNTLLVVDEYQKFYRHKVYNDLYNACGKLLITIFGLLPSLSALPNTTPILQSEILLCSRIDELEIPKVRNIAGDLAYYLHDLAKVPGKNYGQFAYIYKGDRKIEEIKESDVVGYYPPVSLTSTYARKAKLHSRRNKPSVVVDDEEVELRVPEDTVQVNLPEFGEESITAERGSKMPKVGVLPAEKPAKVSAPPNSRKKQVVEAVSVEEPISKKPVKPEFRVLEPWMVSKKKFLLLKFLHQAWSKDPRPDNPSLRIKALAEAMGYQDTGFVCGLLLACEEEGWFVSQRVGGRKGYTLFYDVDETIGTNVEKTKEKVKAMITA